MLKKITYLSLFPEVIKNGLNYSLLQKAETQNKIEFQFVQIRDFAKDKHKSVDDTPFGGGAGMLLKADVLHDAWASVHPSERAEKSRTIFLSPQGKVLTQEYAKVLTQNYEEIIFVCGHYEGVDERFIEQCVDEELSIGDYVLTGGEYPALVVSDVLVRLLPGTVGNENSVAKDSLEDGLLKYPQYTRPREFMGKLPPALLFEGNHAVIEKWRSDESLKRTKEKRPDLYAKKFEANKLGTKE